MVLAPGIAWQAQGTTNACPWHDGHKALHMNGACLCHNIAGTRPCTHPGVTRRALGTAGARCLLLAGRAPGIPITALWSYIKLPTDQHDIVFGCHIKGISHFDRAAILPLN